MAGEITIKLDKGEKQEELRERVIGVINEYSNFFTGFELVGIVDTVREDCHRSIQDAEE